MTTRHSIHEAADRARYALDRSGWEDVLSSGLESLGAVLLDGGVPVRVSVGYSDQPATRDEVRALEQQFAADWPDYTLGPWQAGDGAECVATVRRR